MLSGPLRPLCNHGKVNANVPKGKDPAVGHARRGIELLAERAAKGGKRPRGAKPRRGASPSKSAKNGSRQAKPARAKSKAAAETRGQDARGAQTEAGERRGRNAEWQASLPSTDEILRFIRGAQEKVRQARDRQGVRAQGRRRRLKDSWRPWRTRATSPAAQGAEGGAAPCRRSRCSRCSRATRTANSSPSPGRMGRRGYRSTVLLLARRRGGGPAAGIGDRVLARIRGWRRRDAGLRPYGRVIKRLPREKRGARHLPRACRAADPIEPIERARRCSWSMQKGDEGGARDGDLVEVDSRATAACGCCAQALIVEALGSTPEKAISMIAIHAHELPDDFPEGVIEEAKRRSRHPEGPRGPAPDAARHHRSAGRARPRRRGLRRARPGSANNRGGGS